MSDIEEDTPYRISRGRNWSHRETQLFVTVLENNYTRLVQKKRKAPIFDSMSRQLKNNYGIERSGKEVQNKYKSLIAEYRSEVISAAKQNAPPTHAHGKGKWFDRLDALVKSQHLDDDKELGSSNNNNTSTTAEQTAADSDESVTFLSCAAQPSPSIFDSGAHSTVEASAEESVIKEPLSTISIKKLLKSRHRKRKRDAIAETTTQLKSLRDELKQEASNSSDRMSKMHKSVDELRHFLIRVDSNLSTISSLLYQLVHNKQHPVQTPPNTQSYSKQQFSSLTATMMTPPHVVHRHQYHHHHQRCYSQYLSRHELDNQMDGAEEIGERNFLNL